MNEKIKAYYVADDIDEVLNYIDNLEQENARLKEKIGKAIEYINNLYFDFYDYECDQLIVGKYMVNDLLDILKESSE